MTFMGPWDYVTLWSRIFASLPNFKCQKKQHYLPVPYGKHQRFIYRSIYSHFFLQMFPPLFEDCSTHQSCDFSGHCQLSRVLCLFPPTKVGRGDPTDPSECSRGFLLELSSPVWGVGRMWAWEMLVQDVSSSSNDLNPDGEADAAGEWEQTSVPAAKCFLRHPWSQLLFLQFGFMNQ